MARLRPWRAIVLVALAGSAWMIPLPAALVERDYSQGVYALVQPVITSLSSLAPFAVLDVLLTGAMIWLGARLMGVRRAGAGRRHASLRLVLDFLAGAAVLVLMFLLLWGLNYQRLPLTARLDFDQRRVTPAAVDALAARAVTGLNGTYDSAHADESASAWPALRVSLAPAFTRAQRDLGASRLALAGPPKRSLLSFYFRLASVDGMVNPYGLEVIVNPDVTPMERPFVLSHEWGHLAGWARESEASFVAWVTCLEGDPVARYSGWLSLYWHLRGDVSRDTLAGLDRQLASGPRSDLRAISARLTQAAPWLQHASWRVYDEFLKANRVPEGVRSYDEVVTLVAGTAADKDGRPRLISAPPAPQLLRSPAP